jgi:signal transduction histidine kinase
MGSTGRAYERSGRDGLIALFKQRIADKSFADNVYLLVDPSLAALGGNLKVWPSTVTAAQGMDRVSRAGAVAKRDKQAAAAGNDRLLVGRDISELDSFTEQIKTAVISSVALIFMLAGVASILVTRRTVADRIDQRYRPGLMLSGLDKHIPLCGTNDKWDRVAENLNLMLDRIETLMGEVKQVSDNVAPDLRTPLTRMRGRLEKAYHGQRIGEDDQLLIGDTIAELDAVLRIFSSLTRIAQIETQARKGAFRTVNLVEISNEVVELYDAAAEQDGTRLTVVGDRDLIFDAIANLVDDAIKHGRARGLVVVANENVDGRPVVSIADNGPGIPAGEYEHVFKRFYRLEYSRYTPGNGLRLGLVAAVARLHGAQIEMLDNSPGLKLRLWFAAPTG